MQIGDLVLVPVNGGCLSEGKIISIHGDTVVVSGPEERRLAASSGRSPIGVGFHKTCVVEAKEANNRGR